TKWVLKNKKDERGIVIINKARLVAQGYTKEEGSDYDEVFTPVARIKAIRLFLAYASFMGFTDPTEGGWHFSLSRQGKDGTGKDVDLHLYRSMIGSLMYLTASRPDIMFVVCACARHQVTPKECRLHAVKRIFRYLKGHPKLRLWYPKDSPFDLVAYSDSDYAGATQDRKSTTGGNYKKVGHIIQNCKTPATAKNQRTRTCYEYGSPRHYKSECPIVKFHKCVDMIHGRVRASKPKTIQDAIEIATKLRNKKISTLVECQTENKKRSKSEGYMLRMWESRKTSEEVPEEVKSSDEVPGEKIKELIQLVPIEEVYVEALQVKHHIIEWKETLSVRIATDEKEIELWVELKRLYEPNVKDHLWTHTQHIMHAPMEWRLYDTCGVHHVIFKDLEIFMLVEKNYPLRKALALMMICYKLQVENYSQMTTDLVRKI
nr:hypothetical protein [Tanacetum cinerariifolium]